MDVSVFYLNIKEGRCVFFLGYLWVYGSSDGFGISSGLTLVSTEGKWGEFCQNQN